MGAPKASAPAAKRMAATAVDFTKWCIVIMLVIVLVIVKVDGFELSVCLIYETKRKVSQ